MADLIFRPITENEIDRVRDIDRTEVIRTGYEMTDGRLTRLDVQWDAPPWNPEGDGDHSVAAHVEACRHYLECGGRALAAFDADRLVGIGILVPEIRPSLAQLAYLHVSNGYRRRGIGDQIVDQLFEWARESGAHRIYVSATPSGSAVGFYASRGFVPVSEPLPELFELEPEDIHMVAPLY